jgi:PiT family inorganic phosphate transporter
MSIILLIVVLLIGVSIFINGLTDAPNALAAVISTRVLNPKAAIVIGMIFNLLGVFLLGSAVAMTMANIVTIGTGRDALVTLGGVQLSVIIWALVAWRYGIPTSGTHALIAALMGAGISINGVSALNMNSINKVIIGMAISSFVGFALSLLTTKFIEFSCKNVKRRVANKFFSLGQIISVSLMTFSNGAQDGQKYMGILYLALVIGGIYPANMSGNIKIPIWIMMFCAFLMTVGISAGGYRIIKKMGMEMVHLEKYQGFAAEVVASGSMIVSTLFGIPMSSTNIKGASMMGAGASKGINKVKWNVAKEMILAWVLTFPICMILGFVFSTLSRRIL